MQLLLIRNKLDLIKAGSLLPSCIHILFIQSTDTAAGQHFLEFILVDVRIPHNQKVWVFFPLRFEKKSLT